MTTPRGMCIAAAPGALLPTNPRPVCMTISTNTATETATTDFRRLLPFLRSIHNTTSNDNDRSGSSSATTL